MLSAPGASNLRLPRSGSAPSQFGDRVMKMILSHNLFCLTSSFMEISDSLRFAFNSSKLLNKIIWDNVVSIKIRTALLKLSNVLFVNKKDNFKDLH